MPPCRAIAIASRASVTVSIAAETSGSRRLMLRDSRVAVSASLGITSVGAGQQQHVVEGQAQARRTWRGCPRCRLVGVFGLIG